MSEQNNEQILNQIIDPPAEHKPSGCFSCHSTTGISVIAIAQDDVIVSYVNLCADHRHLAFGRKLTIFYGQEEAPQP